MEYTLTLVARDPKYGKTDLFTDEAPAGGENDPVIAAVMDRLRDRKQPDSHVVYRMSTVADILAGSLEYAKTHTQPPDVLQLVGHGMPGSLAIGHAWLPPGTPIVLVDDDERVAYTLNSNPDIYVQITRRVAPRGTLRVLGCDTGKTTPSGGSIVDGPTFLFALTRALDVPVEGPICMIGADDFDDDGHFNKPEWLMRAYNLGVTQPQDTKPARRALWLSRQVEMR
jgi:hypothetical protein